MEYFSDQEQGHKERSEEVIYSAAWGGIVSYVKSLVDSGAFGEQFPSLCSDGARTVGTNEDSLSLAIKAEIPELEWPLKTNQYKQTEFISETIPYCPETLTILDLIQFCYLHTAKPNKQKYHQYFSHYHLSFDIELGKQEFREKINKIFSRNGLAYELESSGSIKRLAPPVLREHLDSTTFDTSDGILNEMLEDARRKFINPDVKIRKEAVERLWDAWERLKSIKDPSNKKDSITQLLNDACSEPKFRELLEQEARKLTDIGNSFHIRHSEVGQTEVKQSSHFDYLFHRLFCIILLLLNSTS